MQLRSGFAVAFVLTALTACVDGLPVSTDDQDVIGGVVTPEGQYPGVGALYLASQQAASCTGTLIAPDVVLTAAHCIDPLFLQGELPGFTLVHDTVASQPAFTPGARVVQHPMFDLMNDPGPGIGPPWYDIGLVFLAQPITAVAPVRLPTLAEAAGLATGTQLHLVGYGRTSNDTFDTGVMFNAMTDLVQAGTTELMISTPGNPQNCHGDSGGPALLDVGGSYRVVGVVSRSADGTGECLGGGIDTRVDAYLAWIDTEAPGVVCAPPDPRCTPDAAPGPDGGNPIDGDGGGCCSTARGNPAGSVLLALVVGLALIRRRDRGATR